MQDEDRERERRVRRRCMYASLSNQSKHLSLLKASSCKLKTKRMRNALAGSCSFCVSQLCDWSGEAANYRISTTLNPGVDNEWVGSALVRRWPDYDNSQATKKNARWNERIEVRLGCCRKLCSSEWFGDLQAHMTRCWWRDGRELQDGESGLWKEDGRSRSHRNRQKSDGWTGEKDSAVLWLHYWVVPLIARGHIG